jgi:hypothetical protein
LAGFQILPSMHAMALGLVTTLASTWISVRTLTVLVSPERLPGRLQRFFKTRRNAD